MFSCIVPRQFVIMYEMQVQNMSVTDGGQQDM